MPIRCDECGFDLAALSDHDLAEEVRRLGSRYRPPLTRFLPGEDASLLRRRPEERRWSALEYAAHVRDVLILFERRIAAILAEERPVLELVDHDRAVEDGRYIELDPGAVAGEVFESAQRLADRLALVGEEQWERCGLRDGETRTVRDVAQRAVHEGRHHLLDIGRVLRAARGR